MNDLTGERYNQLTAVAFVEKNYHGEAFWRFRCDCGNERVIRASSVKSGNTKSCGCYRVDLGATKNYIHGRSKHRIYHAYRNMIKRCYGDDPRHVKHYRNKGITVCHEWLSSLESFTAWAIENGYAKNLTLDRKNNDEGYSPDNCRWVTQAEQMRNVCRNIKITILGETKIQAEWARILRISPVTINKFIRAGNPPEKLLSLRKNIGGNY